jgi:putative membrane protein
MNNTATILGIVLIVVLVLVLFSGIGMMGMMGFGGYGMMGGYGGMGGMMGGYGAQGFGFNPLGTILSLVFWALIIGGIVLLVVWLARNAGRTGLTAPSGDAALEILKTRYAKGEITKEQYEEMHGSLVQ